jgi:hypothetical protein
MEKIIEHVPYSRIGTNGAQPRMMIGTNETQPRIGTD